jgi:hypothetical protein
MKLPGFVRLLLAPVLFWLGLLGFVGMVVGERKEEGFANTLSESLASFNSN